MSFSSVAAAIIAAGAALGLAPSAHAAPVRTGRAACTLAKVRVAASLHRPLSRIPYCDTPREHDERLVGGAGDPVDVIGHAALALLLVTLTRCQRPYFDVKVQGIGRFCRLSERRSVSRKCYARSCAASGALGRHQDVDAIAMKW